MRNDRYLLRMAVNDHTAFSGQLVASWPNATGVLMSYLAIGKLGKLIGTKLSCQMNHA